MSSAYSPTYSGRFATALAVVGLLTGCHAAFGQSTFGTVLGTVKDPSGSVVPKAKVQLVNTGTNAAREEETGTDGRYQFNNVDVGTYQLKIEAIGFQKPCISRSIWRPGTPSASTSTCRWLRKQPRSR